MRRAFAFGVLLALSSGNTFGVPKSANQAVLTRAEREAQRASITREEFDGASGGTAGGLFPECEGASNDCCASSSTNTPGCGDGEGFDFCCQAVCAIDSFCCFTEWDSLCAAIAADHPGCSQCFDGFSACTESNEHGCCDASGSEIGCESVGCCEAVCDEDPFCCIISWDGICVEIANDLPNDVCLPCPGACCQSIGGCAFEAEENCTGGMYLGPNTDCTSATTGCCIEDGHCADLPAACCEFAGGTILEIACAPPLIICPTDATIECDGSADPISTGYPTATDDCTMLPDATYTDSVVISENCPQTGVISRTWSVTDADDNVSTCVQTITVVDTTPPAIECSEAVVERCLAPGGVPSYLVDIGANATDNCSKHSNCCDATYGLGCETAICEAAVCAVDPVCCGLYWDDLCVAEAGLYCGDLCFPNSDCCFGQETPGCSDTTCRNTVCDCDSFCCETAWDGYCAGEGFIPGCGAALLCTELCSGIDLTDNRPEVYSPTCGDDPNSVTFTAVDECGNVSTCDVEVAVIGAMCCPATTDTDLKLMITDLDLRQDNEGPGNTKARFDIWNSNEVRFSGTERCIICWDETLISDYGPIANHLIIENLQTDKGKARIQNEASTVCPESTDAALLGVAIQETQFAGSPSVEMRSAVTLVGMGEQAARIQYDIIEEPEEANDGSLVITQVPGVGTPPSDPSLNNDDVAVAGGVADNRASTTFKGSLVSWPVIEVKWDQYGTLIQDTFITIVNDNPGQVKIQFYQVNGDAPLDPVFCCDPQELVERAHPGWNWSDYQITLTGDESTYWSVASGLPKGVSPISVLDPGSPNGRPDLDPSNLGGRVIRGFLVGWAVNDNGQEIRWNHLKGHAVVIRYDQATAFDYNPWNFRVVSGVPEGAQSDGNPGNLDLDGVEYDYAPETLLFDFFAAGTQALSHPAVRDSGNHDEP